VNPKKFLAEVQPGMRWMSFDPGLECCGLAFWKGRILVGAGYTSRIKGGQQSGPMVWALHATAALGESLDIGGLVVERMRVYPGSRVNPAGTLQCASVAGALAGALAMRQGVHCPTPPMVEVLAADWKGRHDKKQTAEAVVRSLKPREAGHVTWDCPKGKRHNMVDAVGLGLWFLGRLEWEE
jgi:hypothetical protein